jgi:hypothetical protein
MSCGQRRSRRHAYGYTFMLCIRVSERFIRDREQASVSVDLVQKIKDCLLTRTTSSALIETLQVGQLTQRKMVNTQSER